MLTGLDIAWVADGIQRDSESVRKAVDLRLRDKCAVVTVLAADDVRTSSWQRVHAQLKPAGHRSAHRWWSRCRARG